ncbi:class I SAM-dependent methyltransferase [Seonamhaeicola maritimus]|uniref:class I SAM-dependent methyltransferase n=1 Tax=Seonamhaeicola maritimus TaxID=2591822 RepID=UPI00147827AF|nr:methyltransferase domain-containing protein [Seonamhaeicola maritimus]
MNKKLTTQSYWEDYYSDNHANKQHIINVCSFYDDFWEIFIDSKSSVGKTLIEIGGFPGRYLSYLASKFKVCPTCLDFNSDRQQIEKSFEVLEVNRYNIIQEDFTLYKPQKRYDYVFSNGFVEHFEEYNNILDLHNSYLNKKGRLMLMIPNMKGYIKYYKKLVDNENLKIHNLKCMSLSVFEDFAQRNNLKVVELTYFGGFPFSVHQKLNLIQKIIFKIHRLVFKFFLNKYVHKYPSKYFSSTIIAIFEKP